MPNLNSIEKLQVCGLINKDYFNIKNKLYCFLFQLTQKNVLKFKDNKYKFGDFNKETLNMIYEEDFLKLIKEKRYYELGQFLNQINFLPSLKNKRIIREHITKSKFNLFNKTHIEKTEDFYTIYNSIIENAVNGRIITEICSDTTEEENIKKLVDKILKSIKLSNQ